MTAKTRKRRRELACLYRYAVRPLHPEVKPEDIFVFNFVDPMLLGVNLPSPMDGLLPILRITWNMERRLQSIVEWNSSKHIITSERVDMLKDQTMEGMSLLDSFRRYLHSGEHDGINRFYMTRPGLSGMHAKNPTDDRRAQINDTLQGPETEVHVLPPNTEISELQSLDLKTNMLEVQEVLQRQVI